MGRQPLSDADRQARDDRIVAMLKTGATHEDIAKAVGCSSSWVQKVSTGHRPKYAGEEERDAKELRVLGLRGGGLSSWKIADEVGYSQAHVHRILKRHGLSGRA